MVGLLLFQDFLVYPEKYYKRNAPAAATGLLHLLSKENSKYIAMGSWQGNTLTHTKN
jgi:hypothetical protein